MSIYINGIGSISAQYFSARAKTNQFTEIGGNQRPCVEPDYSKLLPPMQLRRMSRVVKMGVAAAKEAMADAGIQKPDIISTGTAYGCLADTESFLTKMIVQEESMLTPTAFIQSTHNTVSGQIALLLSCHGHNFTYVQRGHSFESALQETLMWLHENPELNILSGGMDEMTANSFEIISRFGTYKKEHDHYATHSEGTVAGEGAHLFVLSARQSPQSYAVVTDIHLCGSERIDEELHLFLKQNNLNASDIDTCLIGSNGDIRYDEAIIQNCRSLSESQMIDFKKWCGEYPTSGSFALALACNFLFHKQIPEIFLTDISQRKPFIPKNVLIYNHYKNQYHSFILLRAL